MKLPFSLFNFKIITEFEPKVQRVSAAAGDAIPETTIYEVPENRIALLLGVTVECTKTTSTAFRAYIKRTIAIPGLKVFGIPKGVFPKQFLIHETLGTTEVYASWPAAKNAGNWVLAWSLMWLHAGDKVCISQALTAAETIVDDVVVNRIEYLDPRKEKKS